MSNSNFDVIVIGSGPAGSVLSTFLRQKGYRVVMLERERFPRFHVGESLLPASQGIWERMGIAESLQHSGYTFKYAGEFRIGRNPVSDDICTTTGFFNNFPRKDLGIRPYAYQVERAVFDKQLQDHAVAQGVELWDKISVSEVVFEGDRAVGVRYRRGASEPEVLRADFIVDASGRRAVMGRQLNCIEDDPIIKTSACFGHFHGVTRDPGVRQGFFNGYFIEHGWMWFIPLVDDVMSVGIVQNEPANLSWSNDPEEVLRAGINRYQFIQNRFKNATQVGRIRSIKGLAYTTRQFTGDGWLSIGDANFFVDPLYSSGVQIAHKTGDVAAGVVDEFLKNNRSTAPLRRYERFIKGYRRNVFGPMRALYRLMRNYECIDSYVRVTGLWCGNFNNWFLRRANCWGSGNFDKHVWAVRIMEYFANVFAHLAPPLFRLRGDDGWRAYERNPNPNPPLDIPKHERLHQAPGSEEEEAARYRPLTSSSYDGERSDDAKATPLPHRHPAEKPTETAGRNGR